MKYVILIHSNPQPWGHPTGDFTEQGRALPAARREALGKAFDEMLERISESRELVTAEALGDPGESTIYRWQGDTPLATQGPYAEAAEHLAGFFLIDVASRERAEEIAREFVGPDGDTIELRPAYVWPEDE